MGCYTFLWVIGGGAAGSKRAKPEKGQESKVLTTHRYTLGQSVRYTAGPFGRFGASGSFKIVKLLPSDGEEFQYRIKSTGEAFERVAKESQLDRDR